LTHAAARISQSDFALNPAILQSVRALTGAEVITFTPGGLVLASTTDPQQQAELIAAVTSPDAVARGLVAGAQTDAPVLRLSCGTPCYVAFRRPAALPDTIVAVVRETSELNAATQAVTRTIVVAAILALAAMILVSQIVARRVTAPIQALATFAQTAK